MTDNESNKKVDKVIIIDNNVIFNEIITTHKKVVIFYGDTTCLSCIKYKPLYFRFAKKYHKKCTFLYTNVTDVNLNFPSLPYLVSYVNGHEFLTTGEDGINTELIKTLLLPILKLKL